MTTRLADFLAATATASAFWMADSVTAMQTQIPSLTGTDEEKILRWAAEKGGLFVMVLIILWFYRRDFRQAASERQSQTNALLHVVRENITTMTDLRAANAALQATVDRLTTTVQELKAVNDRLTRAVEENAGRRRRGDQA
jgi:hypothetical protein